MTKRGGFRRREQPVYLLPVLITDSGSPALSSTNTLPVRVCDCDSDGVALACGAVAYTATGLSTGALLAILSCIITLLGKALAISLLPAICSCCGFCCDSSGHSGQNCYCTALQMFSVNQPGPPTKPTFCLSPPNLQPCSVFTGQLNLLGNLLLQLQVSPKESAA